MKTITVKLVFQKEHKTLVEYAEVDAQGVKLLKPKVTPIYVRKNGEELPAAYTLTLTPTEA